MLIPISLQKQVPQIRLHSKVTRIYIPRRKLHVLSGQFILVLCHSQSKVICHVQIEHLVVQFVSVTPCSVIGHHHKELGTILLTLAH